MRIAGWHVDGFGHLCDLEAHDLPPGLLVLHGPNEAGKSTLVDFLTGMLFGFPSGNTKLPKRPPLRGGQHGGRLWLVDDDGEALLVSRSGRTVTIRQGRGDVLVSPTEYATRLGGATRRLFDAVFSVSLDDLHSLDALTDDELNDLVFSAGVVGAGRSATSAIELLDRRRNELYRPRGRTETYTVLHLRNLLREADERLAVARRAAATVPTLRAALVHADDEATALRAEVAELDAADHRLGLLLDLWPSAADALAAERELRAQPPGPPVAPEAATRLDHLEAALAAARVDVAEAERSAADAEVQAGAIGVDAAALALAEPVDALRRRQPLISRDRHDSSLLRGQIAVAEREIDTLLADLGGTIDRRSLVERGHDLATADRLAARADALQQVHRDEAAARAAVTQVQDEAAERRARLEARRIVLDAEGPADGEVADERVAALEALAGRLEASDRAAVATDASHPSATGRRWVPALLGVAALVFLVTGVASWRRSAADAVVLVAGGVALVVLAAALVRPARVRPSPPVPGSADRDLWSAATELGLPDAGAGTVRLALLEARRRRDQVAARAVAWSVLEREAAEVFAVDHARGQEVARRAAVAAEAAAAADREWSRWLDQRHLPADLSPAGAAQFCESWRAARARVEQVADATARAEVIEARVSAFADAVAALAAELGERAAGAEPDTTLERLSSRVAQAVERAAARREADQRVRSRHEALLVASTRLEAAEAAIAELLAETGVASGADLRAAVAAGQVRAAGRARVDSFERALLVAAGPAAATTVRAELAGGDPAGWEAMRRDIAGRRAAAEAHRDQVVDEAGARRRRLAEVEQSADVATLMLEVAGLRGELQAAVERWMVLSLARGLVSETLARYQRERQPRVLARAQQLFGLVTAGRYPVLRTDDRTVVAVDQSGRDVVASALSRGTREQLYLCLRFALAESFAERASLPIILDDVLVNFDPQRAAQVAVVVADVAQRHQVVAFTCHPWVRDLLVAAAPTATELSLDCTSGALVPVHHGASSAVTA